MAAERIVQLSAHQKKRTPNRIMAALQAITVFAFKANKRHDYYNKHLTRDGTMN